MLKKISLVLLLVFYFSSCVTYLKDIKSGEAQNKLSDKFKNQTLRIYFVNSSEADLQNVVLFRELILTKKLFNEVLLVQNEKIESCKGQCIFFQNVKSGLSIGEKINMGASWLTLGLVPARFTNKYFLKNKYSHKVEVELVYWGSTFLLFYLGNKSFDTVEQQQLKKLLFLLDKADAFTETTPI